MKAEATLLKLRRCLRPTKVLAIAGKPDSRSTPTLIMLAFVTAQSAAAGERCSTRSNLIAFASLRRSKTWRPIRSIRIPPRIISARRAVYCHSGSREPDQGYGQSIFGACQTSIWVPPDQVRLRKPPLVNSNQATAVFQNRPLRSETGWRRQAQETDWQLQNL